MKIGALLLRTLSVIAVLVLQAGCVLFCVLFMTNTLGLTINDLPVPKTFPVSVMSIIGFLEIGLFVIYWTIWSEYGSLKGISTEKLLSLLILSSLSAIMDISGIIHHCYVFVPYVIQEVGFLSYAPFSLLSVLTCMQNAINPFMAFRTAHTLYIRCYSSEAPQSLTHSQKS